ncbi:hypothetical protein PHISP_02590 [Aspergillus sp. HF37]|nr:hypothetical protein PHISP_02590 [Aspergillus sp. HF37]
MPLKEIVQKRDKLRDHRHTPTPEPSSALPVPEIRFVRSDTTSQEAIDPHDNDNEDETDNPACGRPRPGSPVDGSSPSRSRLSLFHRSRSPSASTTSTAHSNSPPACSRGERRLSQLLHLDRGRTTGSRNSSGSSLNANANVPADLPQINNDSAVDEQDREAQWEKRATLLVQRNPRFGASNLSSGCTTSSIVDADGRPGSRSSSPGRVNDPEGDVNIQEAIRLHEAGDLETSTRMFGRLADPNGADNALSQVLYGLALRHGWGCVEDPQQAVTYLTAAASNSASIESEALRAGVKKGGAAKGELVLAIYELANCFRNGWGVQRDPAAARQYYETAANLGDSDAMNEAAWCYLEGFGGKKDKL